MLLASSDVHPAAAHPTRATHSAFSDSSFPSSSATAYRPVRASNDSTLARLPLCSGLATSRYTSTRVPAGSNRIAPAAAGAAALVGGVARMAARTFSKLRAVASVLGWRVRVRAGSMEAQQAASAQRRRFERHRARLFALVSVRMLGPDHALPHLMHLALDPLSFGVFALV